MSAFTYQDMFPLGPDTTTYRQLTTDFVSTGTFQGRNILVVAPEGLTLLAEQAFKEVSHLLRPSHLKLVGAIFTDPDASENDRLVALEMVKNAVIAADGVYPLCQDTGTAIILGKKGQQVWTGADDAAALSRGVFSAYTENYLRYSQNAPLTMFAEQNTRCNLPAQIDLYATEGDAYK